MLLDQQRNLITRLEFAKGLYGSLMKDRGRMHQFVSKYVNAASGNGFLGPF